jgi:hypothetical protein
MRRRALFEGREPTQNVDLAVQGDLDPAVGSREHREQALQQHLVERIDYLAKLPGIFRSSKCLSDSTT